MSAGAAVDWLDRWFIPAALVILVVAAEFRLPELALNPFHHDEGVNGFFTTNLVRNGTYTYDPANYHGPSLYYLALLSELLFGLTTEAMRFVPVAFGLLLVGLVFGLRRYLGSVATLSAAALLAVSPGMVYVSRYFIHEMLLVALTLAVVVTVSAYLDRRRPAYLLAAAVAAAFLFTTKETAVITVAVLLIAVVVGHYYTAWRNPSALPRRQVARPTAGARSIWVDGVEYRPARSERGPAVPTSSLLPRWIPGEHLAGVLVIFLVIYVLLFSSFFTNFPKGLIDSLTAYAYWFQHGDATQVQPPYRYLQWLVPIGDSTLIPVDVPILLLGVVGGVIAAIRAPSRAWVILGLWAAGITAAYSLIQYKTPWIIVNMLLPLALLAGLAVQQLWQSRFRLAVPVVVGAAVAINGFQAIDLNFFRYDDQAYGYVYVHST
ncbi:MAG: TIGR03663 family protein, partial [Chloroflexi bacterium]|nr:TIGR03663 family protein [Chloroflexota bacterium]